MPANDSFGIARNHPWSLSRFPNYRDALPIPTIAAGSITEDEFRRRYVEDNTPCLLTGAASHWPAKAKWSSLQYLRDQTTRYATVQVNYRPIKELTELPQNFVSIKFHDFLDKLASHDDFIRGCGQLNPQGGLAGLIPDLGTYPFLPALLGSRYYEVYRFMIYRRSYSDWHYHPTDETLMTQISGAKEILMLPPDEKTWKTLMPVIAESGFAFDVDVARFPDFSDLRPYRVFSNAGDALYIPVFWWHAVESLDNEIGVTIPATWGSPLSVLTDDRLPAVRAQRRAGFAPVR